MLLTALIGRLVEQEVGFWRCFAQLQRERLVSNGGCEFRWMGPTL